MKNEMISLQKELMKKYQAKAWEKPLRFWKWDQVIDEIKKPRSVRVSDFLACFDHPEDLTRQGVKFYDLSQATGIARKKIFVLLNETQEKNKLDLWQMALSVNQFVVEIPDGVCVELSFCNKIQESWPVIIFYCRKGSRFAGVFKFEKNHDVFSGVSFLFIAEDESELNLACIDKIEANHHLSVSCFLETQAKLQLTTFGKYFSKNHVSFNIFHEARESEAECIAALSTHASACTYLKLFSNHERQYASTHIESRVLAADASLTHIDGLIRIGAKARFAKTYLDEDVLLLSEQTMVKTIPNLEILNNEVTAGHSATLGSIDPTQLFYLQARGLTFKQAKTMIAHGFFQPLFERIHHPLIRKYFQGEMMSLSAVS